jgi:hypothetical protein
LAASAAAARTAVRRAVGLAPRTVSFTWVPLRIRKVGILAFGENISARGQPNELKRTSRYEVDVRRNTIIPRNLPLRIDVDFAEDDLARFALCGRELLENGRDDFARPAPVGVKVDDCVGCRGGEGAEVRGGSDGGDFGRHCVGDWERGSK